MKCFKKRQSTKNDSENSITGFTGLNDKNSRSLLISNRSLFPVQPKLKMGQANDSYEKEADRIANQVINSPEKHPVENAFKKVNQTVQGNTGKGEVSANIESRIGALKGGGQPLPESTRSFFEPRFGHDFSKVKVHADSGTAETAKEMNARAFTTGSNIFFGKNEYTTGTSSGRRLLAHELTHVAQQRDISKNHFQPQVSNLVMRLESSIKTAGALTPLEIEKLSKSTDISDLAYRIFIIVFLKRLVAFPKLKNINLGTYKITIADVKALRKHLTAAINITKNVLAADSVPGRLIRKNEKYLKLLVATFFVSQRALAEPKVKRTFPGKTYTGDFWDCTTRTAQIHAQAMFIAGFEKEYEHQAGRKTLKSSDVFGQDGGELTGKIRGTKWSNVFGMKLSKHMYYGRSFHENAVQRLFAKNPWDNTVQVGDVVLWLKKSGRIFKAYHMGTIFYIDREKKIAAVIETWLKFHGQGVNRKQAPIPTRIILFSAGAKSRNFKIPGFEHFKHHWKSNFRRHFGSDAAIITRYKDVNNLTSPQSSGLRRSGSKP